MAIRTEKVLNCKLQQLRSKTGNAANLKQELPSHASTLPMFVLNPHLLGLKEKNRKYTNMTFWPPLTTIHGVQPVLEAKYQLSL